MNTNAINTNTPSPAAGTLNEAAPVQQPHEARVLIEHDDLEDKVKKLGNFIGAEKFYMLAHDEQDRLQVQFAHMLGYLRVLKTRIEAAFANRPKGVTHVAATDTEPERTIPNA